MRPNTRDSFVNRTHRTRRSRSDRSALVAGEKAELVAAALAYARCGMSIIPTIGKVAAGQWKDFQRCAADESTLRRLFDREGITGVAVILGEVSGGLACRDYDKAAGYECWAAAHPDLASTLPTVRTSRGFHVYHRGPTRFEILHDGEYRADAGHYCLLPPSLHPDGSKYHWVNPLPEGELPLLNPDEAGLLTSPPQPQQHSANPTHSAHSLHVSPRDVQTAMLTTLPTGPGQRNRRVFDFARLLKGIMPDAGPSTLEPIVREWHARALPTITTKDWAETWLDFLIAWKRVKTPAGVSMAQIEAAANLPAYPEPIAKLTALCRAMQAAHGAGQAWPLSCRVAGEQIGVGRSKAARLLKLLQFVGVIELAKPAGPQGSRKAAEYRFLGEGRR